MFGILLQVTTAGTDTIAQAGQTLPPPAEDTFSLLDMILRGGVIMIPIAFLSIVALYVFISRYLVVKRVSKDEAGFMLTIRQMIHEGNIESALVVCRSNNKPIARMIEKGILRLGRPIKEINESVEIVGKFEIYKLEKNLLILGIIAGIAPMFGFIGTIIGVIKIFYDISLQGDVSISSVSAGLYTKMVSSAAGLLVGIVSFVLYHWLNMTVDRVAHKLEYSAMEFIDLLQEPSK